MEFMGGYDLEYYQRFHTAIPLKVILNHTIIVGGSGSGKSTCILYWLYKIKHLFGDAVELYISDFKHSNEFIGITDHFAQGNDVYGQIMAFYDIFQNTPEGGGGKIRLFVIDEIAGLLMHLGMTKEGKTQADKVRQILSSVLMLGRSRKCFLWLSMQRYTASIFPSASGAVDNMGVCLGLGNLTVDGRRGLFAGEHLENEEQYLFGQGKGIILIEGKPLQALVLPKLSKRKLLYLLQTMN